MKIIKTFEKYNITNHINENYKEYEYTISYGIELGEDLVFADVLLTKFKNDSIDFSIFEDDKMDNKFYFLVTEESFSILQRSYDFDGLYEFGVLPNRLIMRTEVHEYRNLNLKELKEYTLHDFNILLKKLQDNFKLKNNLDKFNI